MLNNGFIRTRIFITSNFLVSRQHVLLSSPHVPYCKLLRGLYSRKNCILDNGIRMYLLVYTSKPKILRTPLVCTVFYALFWIFLGRFCTLFNRLKTKRRKIKYKYTFFFYFVPIINSIILTSKYKSDTRTNSCSQPNLISHYICCSTWSITNLLYLPTE